MADLIESARGILSVSQRQMDATANNVANLTTPGFKTERLYSEVSPVADPDVPETLLRERLDLGQGRLAKSNNPLDLAISGAGMFRLRGADGAISYSRAGQFKIGEAGRLVNAQGLALQALDGDLIVPDGRVRILADGTVLDGERPVGRIGIYAPASGASLKPIGGSLFSIPEDLVEEVASPEIRQEMLETSNVQLADQMVSMMEAMRSAEGGARMVQTYDDLMGRAISTLGQGAR
jgi:flagellar basal-body rod protein FlgF